MLEEEVSRGAGGWAGQNRWFLGDTISLPRWGVALTPKALEQTPVPSTWAEGEGGVHGVHAEFPQSSMSHHSMGQNLPLADFASC